MSDEKRNSVALLDQSLQMREMSRQQFNVLKEIIHPNAKSDKSVLMAFDYCKARGLDPFKKVVHVVPVWSSKANDGHGGYIETIWPGISEIRTTAMRTKEYAGCDATEFGPAITKTFKGKVKDGKEWVQKEVTVTFPEWIRITVYRYVNGVKCAFPGPTVRWLEEYASAGNSELPNAMWTDRPYGQGEKCAEAASLRKAFPEEAGTSSAEEMEGKKLYDEDDSMVVDGSTVTLVSTGEVVEKDEKPAEKPKRAPTAKKEEKEPAKEAAKEEPKEPPAEKPSPAAEVDIEDAEETQESGEDWFNKG